MFLSVFFGNGRSSRGDGRTSVWRSNRNTANPRPTTRAATLAAAVPSTPSASTPPRPFTSTRPTPTFTAFMARLAPMTSPTRAKLRRRAVMAKNAPCKMVVEPTISRNEEPMPHSVASMCSHPKNCGQNVNSTAVMSAPRAMFTTSATVAISDIVRLDEAFPSTRVTSTVDAVPMADNAMVMMLSICSALPTAAAGSVPCGASIIWFTLPTMICMNSSMNSGTDSTNTSADEVFSAGARPARALRASPARRRAPCACPQAPCAHPRAPWANAVMDMGFSAPFHHVAPPLRRTRLRSRGVQYTARQHPRYGRASHPRSPHS